MKKLLFFVLLVLTLAAVGIYGYGRNLPESYEVERSVAYGRPIETVWQAISDYERLPEWSRHIEKVEKQEDQEGMPVWRLFNRDGHYMDIQVVRAEEPAVFVSRIAETDLPFGGVWTFLLVRKPDGTTQVTLKEEGYVETPLWRLALWFVIGKEAMIDRYLADLGRKFGEIPDIR